MHHTLSRKEIYFETFNAIKTKTGRLIFDNTVRFKKPAICCLKKKIQTKRAPFPSVRKMQQIACKAARTQKAPI